MSPASARRVGNYAGRGKQGRMGAIAGLARVSYDRPGARVRVLMFHK